MCCLRINTDVLMANLFSAITASGAKCQVSLRLLKNYLDFLTEMFPVYLATDFCEQKVVECAAKYPQLYQANTAGAELLICPGKEKPNLGFFNDVYSKNMSEYIQKTTYCFLKGQNTLP